MTDSHHATIDPEPMDLALQFLSDHPSEKPVTAARIFNVNESSLRSTIQRAKAKATNPNPAHGGHNKILQDAQVTAIYKYVEDSYYAGYGASKSMVLMAIAHLRAKEIPPKPEPLQRWFQMFIKQHPTLFCVIKTKAIARVRVSAQDVESVENWFAEYKAWCIQHRIELQNVHNFDKTGFCVGVALGEEVVVPAYVTEVSYLYSNLRNMNLCL